MFTTVNTRLFLKYFVIRPRDRIQERVTNKGRVSGGGGVWKGEGTGRDCSKNSQISGMEIISLSFSTFDLLKHAYLFIICLKRQCVNAHAVWTKAGWMVLVTRWEQTLVDMMSIKQGCTCTGVLLQV